MSIRVKEVKLKNVFYVLQFLIRKVVILVYRRLIGPDPVAKMYNKIEKCKPCFNNGECLECGCDFKAMILSDKPCPKGNF